MFDDRDYFTYSSDTEWDNAEAWERGQANPNQAWILTDRDVWHRNPFYHGPAVRHPEDDDYGDGEPDIRNVSYSADLELDDMPF